MGFLELDGLSKLFTGPEAQITAVDDVSIEIADGAFVVLVGPSGSGKSTILRLLAGLERPTAGRIRLDGRDITDVKPKNRDVAMVFQNYALYPHLTARKNISFGLKMQGELSAAEIDERVEEAAEIMEIGELLDKMPGELSGGQKQRVALGRAIVRDPKVFLMDEPLSNLDAKLRTSMRTEIQRLHDELGVTTVYVTHDQTEAMTMSDRVAVMNDARLQQIDTPMETYYRPANLFVAGFIGSPSMNFIDVSARTDGDQVVLERDDFSYRIDVSTAGTDLPSQVVMGIRPEDIEFTDEDSDVTHAVTVEVIEPLGKEQLFYFHIGDSEYTASVSGRTELRKGETVTIRFPQDRVYLFDANSGERLGGEEPSTAAEEEDFPLGQGRT